jgi:hypothetical protein
MRTCTVQGCDEKHEARGFCEKHYARWKRHGAPVIVTAERGCAINADGYRWYARKLEHIAVAERAFGGPLPQGAIVHHFDYDKTNNANSNLLVCDRSYHRLIHQRTDAFNACGHADWRKCSICKQYDDPANLAMYPSGTSGDHNSCRRKRAADKKAALKDNFDVPGARLVKRDRLTLK